MGTLAEFDLDPSCLALELTESSIMQQPERARATLDELRRNGLRIAVDDFGTGYSSLVHLKRFPIDVLKIDQGFMRDIPASGDDMAISATIIAMGRSLGLNVLAEGVETPEQLGLLQRLGCELAQGFGIAAPMDAGSAHAWLQMQPPAQTMTEA